MKVRMLKDTNYMGFKPVGSEHEVDNSVGLRWINKGIAEPIGPIVAEEGKKDNGGDAIDNSPSKYAGMKAKELYESCKERGINAEPKKPVAYYVELLELDDSTNADAGEGKDGEGIDGDGKGVE